VFLRGGGVVSEVASFPSSEFLIIHLCFFSLKAIECELCEVQPSYSSNCPSGMWSSAACSRFMQLTHQKKLVAKVTVVLIFVAELLDKNTWTDNSCHCCHNYN
jgi:hypothetical protein